MFSRGATILLLSVCGLAVCCGCGPKTSRRPMGGTVTFHGKPLEHGVITFLPADRPGQVCGATIDGGRFDIPAPQGLDPGNYRVEISSPGPPAPQTPEEIAAQASPRAQEMIPPAYNEQSTLTVTVKADGSNEFHFDVP